MSAERTKKINAATKNPELLQKLFESDYLAHQNAIKIILDKYFSKKLEANNK